MVGFMAEGTHDNDNDPISFLSLAALTANVTRFLFDQKKEEPNRDGGDAEREQNPVGDRDYIDDSLRRIRAFERRAAGIDRPARKRRE
jgi:hypothetical protein